MGIKRVLGASQGSRVGQGVTSRLQSAGEAARTGLTKATEKFEDKAGEESRRLGTQSQAARGALAGIMGAQGQAAAPTAEQQAAFQSIASGQLQSPMGLEQAEELRIKAEQAGRLGALAGTQSGRQELLRQQFAQRGGYGAKQSALDALILGKTAGKELAQARSGLAGIGREVSTEERAAAERARGLKEEATGLSRELLGGLEAETSGIQKAVEAEKERLTTSQKEAYDKLTKALKTGEVEEGDTKTLDLLKKAGIQEGGFLGGLSEEEIKQYVSKAAGPELKTVITPEQFAKISALEKLGGSTAAGKISPITSLYKDIKTPEEAGKYKQEEEVGFAKTGEDQTKTDLEKTLSGRKGEIEGKLPAEEQRAYETGRLSDDISYLLSGKANMNNLAGFMGYASKYGIQVAPKISSSGKILPKDQVWMKDGSPMHPNDIIAWARQQAAESAQNVSSFRGTLGKTLKIKPKATT
jgi:hypothetical protein